MRKTFDVMKRLTFTTLALASAVLAQGQTPPPIPHAIDGYMVTRQENNCLECHDRPREIGKKRAKGVSPAAPTSHYGRLDGKAEIASAYFLCTSCHVHR